MALKLNERYPGRFDNPSVGYPQGSFKNRTTPTAKDGSYLEKDWANDKEGFFQSLLAATGVPANGLVDKVGDSQYYDALIKILSTPDTPPQFDISQKVSTTEFVQRALGNKRYGNSIAASRAITANDWGCEVVIVATEVISLTLPSFVDIASGASIRFVNLGWNRCNFFAAQNEYFIGAFDVSGLATTFFIEPGDEVSITLHQGLWVVVGSGSYAQNRSINGFKKISGGLIEQWGIWTSSPIAGDPVAVTFPVAYVGGILTVQCTPVWPSASVTPSAWLDNNATLTGFNGRSNGVNRAVYWRSLGF